MHRTATCFDLLSYRLHLACKILFATCLAIALVGSHGRRVQGQTIVNPSFESPDLSPGDWIEAPTNAGWTFQPSTGILAYTSFPVPPYKVQPITPPPDGTQFGVLGAERSIQQTISGFTVGQAYRLDWFQGYGASAASGGGAVTARLETAGGGTAKTIAPLELANSPSLAPRSSDVFIATSESYDLIIQNSGEVPLDYGTREAMVDNFAFVPVDEPATTRTSHSTNLLLTSASNLEIDGLIGGVSLEADIASSLSGFLSMEFDVINGEVANLHFNHSDFYLDSVVAGVFELGVLGSADVTVTNGVLDLFHEQSSQLGQHRTAVDENGEFRLGSTFVGYSGLGELDLNGPIGTLLGEDSLVFDFEDIAVADLGIVTIAGTKSFPGPGTIDLSPTGNPSEYLLTVGIPVLIATTLASEAEFEIEISGYIEAQGIVVVPEPSGFALALLAVGLVGGSALLRRWQCGTSSV